jgi:hypothetical protein
MDKQLLVIDAIIDLVLGLVLIAFPRELIKLVGAPPVENAFYPSLLGAVVFGIGVALLIECFSGPNGPYGLGLAGALAINLCGGIALWALAGILFILSFFELISHWWKKA